MVLRHIGDLTSWTPVYSFLFCEDEGIMIAKYLKFTLKRLHSYILVNDINSYVFYWFTDFREYVR